MQLASLFKILAVSASLAAVPAVGLAQAPYPARANKPATASTPLEWDEVGQVHPDDFDVTTVPARFAERGKAAKRKPGKSI